MRMQIQVGSEIDYQQQSRMLEITILSLFVGSLGLQASFIGGWMRWQQIAVAEAEEEEEEILSGYESKADTDMTVTGLQNAAALSPSGDVRMQGWEYKIVRASRDLFRDPAILKRLCEEEAEAGWVLLEKLDDRRVRFKRPVALRDLIKPGDIPFDPYRSSYGPSSKPLTLVGMIAALVAILLPAYLGYALVSSTLSQSRGWTNSPMHRQVEPNPSPTD